MLKRICYYIFVYLLWFTWALPDTIFGICAFIITCPFIKEIHTKGGSIIVRIFKEPANGGGWGFEAGCFIFSNTQSIYDDNGSFFCHEYGHCVPQALVFGPLHLFICGIPSAIRFWYRDMLQSKGIQLKTNYDDFWVEGTATKWGWAWYQSAKKKGWIK